MIALGYDHTARFVTFAPDLDLNPQYRDLPGDPSDPVGAIIDHPHKGTGELCSGVIHFDTPRARRLGSRNYWTLCSLDPLHVEPSVLCSCGDHGFIRNGQWQPT